MAEKINRKQVEQIARRMGYNGPMSKFAEFLMSSPKRGYATGGVVEPLPVAPTTSSTTMTNAGLPPPPPMPTAPTVDVAVDPLNVNSNQLIAGGTGLVHGTPNVTFTEAETATAAAPKPVTTTTYDASKTQPGVEDVVNQYQYATGTLAPESTTQGQMELLMADLEDGSAAWADPAMRQATAEMNARGLGSSSMAAAATTTAAMEAAIPIAMADAQLYAQMQFQNLSNEQQALMLANEARTNALFTDVAAENAAKQFNAASDNQVKQFNANLKTQVDQFNTSQLNAMEQFNAGQKNTMSMFKADMEMQRLQFNAQNELVVAQANAQWQQQVATINNASINEANRIEAQLNTEAALTEMSYYFQERRDLMNYAYSSAESEADRAMQLLLAQMSLEETQRQSESASSDAMWEAVGALTSEFITGIF